MLLVASCYCFKHKPDLHVSACSPGHKLCCSFDPLGWTSIYLTSALFLLQEVQSEDPLHQQRTLLVFNHVIKMLASKRLMCDRQLFRQVLKGGLIALFSLNFTIVTNSTIEFR